MPGNIKIAQITPNNAEDVNQFFGNVRFPSEEELKIETLKNNEGVTITPLQAYKINIAGRFTRCWFPKQEGETIQFYSDITQIQHFGTEEDPIIGDMAPIKASPSSGIRWWYYIGQNQWIPVQGEKGEKGDTGDIGPANTLSIGTVEQGNQANATITGEAPNQILNLTLPQGNPNKIIPASSGIVIPGKSQENPEVQLSEAIIQDEQSIQEIQFTIPKPYKYNLTEGQFNIINENKNPTINLSPEEINYDAQTNETTIKQSIDLNLPKFTNNLLIKEVQTLDSDQPATVTISKPIQETSPNITHQDLSFGIPHGDPFMTLDVNELGELVITSAGKPLAAEQFELDKNGELFYKIDPKDENTQIISLGKVSGYTPLLTVNNMGDLFVEYTRIIESNQLKKYHTNTDYFVNDVILFEETWYLVIVDIYASENTSFAAIQYKVTVNKVQK